MLVDDQVEVYLCMNAPVFACLYLVCFMHFASVYVLCFCNAFNLSSWRLEACYRGQNAFDLVF